MNNVDLKGETARIVTDEQQLSIICQPITEENEDGAKEIERDLLKTAKLFAKHHPMGCAGLAANQLGYDLRMFVIKTKKGWQFFGNPTFTSAGPKAMKTEGCLSRPGRPGVKVLRHSKIKVKSMGNKRGLLVGLEAQAFQHELDHLNGILI